ncbi:MAG: hypothetical protein C0410_06115 [Anaerolinea sp.]|nr:hypothetical protein [Anaerolinea sp.]
MDTTTIQVLVNDKYIKALSNSESILSQFTKIFPGANTAQTDSTWLDKWFVSRAQYFHKNPDEQPLKKIDPPETLIESISTEKITNSPFKLLDIQPNYFRGFRSLENPISLADGLVVIDGPNSSGKTSIAESFEWLFTGQLIRRNLQGLGAPKELENCIGNQLRPETEATWVEASIQLTSGKKICIRRELITDYGITSTSLPSSKLIVDGVVLSKEGEYKFLETLGLNIPPILMQHTLRLFVQSSPSQRRDYFEKLLQLDEITYLVEKAVVGDARLYEFKSSGSGVALAKWNSLKSGCQVKSSKILMSRIEQSPQEIEGAILSVGREELGTLIIDADNINNALKIVKSKQQEKRQEVFPILGMLRPTRIIDDQLQQFLSIDNIKIIRDQLRDSLIVLDETRRAARDISDANIIIANALSQLEKIDPNISLESSQNCPFCEFEPIQTLTIDRINKIKSWSPAKEAISKQELSVIKNSSLINDFATNLISIINALIPEGPTNTQWNDAIKVSSDVIADTATKLLIQSNKTHLHFAPILESLNKIKSNASTNQVIEVNYDVISQNLEFVINEIPNILELATDYKKLFLLLDNAIGAISKEDPNYLLRDLWQNVAVDQVNIIADLNWEISKKKAQIELEGIRNGLILARQTILGARRTQFSDDMNKVWKKLREDKYSAFSQLFIPEPRGRGFPIEIEVKAILDDGIKQVEVDALRVFSESQVHVLGIAAFLTRSNLLGHQCLIFDDPVQSMDEDHFLSFSSGLLRYLLEQGYQIIILTHNDLFSRDVSHEFANTEKYTTLAIRHSRKKGCCIEEGNRRASERLKKAQDRAEEGKFDDAWKIIRLAIERIYLCVMIKNNSTTFNPRSWSDQTAEYMWQVGVGELICKRIPEAEKRFHDILQMTVAGAHDKSARGLTDITGSIRFLLEAMETLKIGAA